MRRLVALVILYISFASPHAIALPQQPSSREANVSVLLIRAEKNLYDSPDSTKSLAGQALKISDPDYEMGVGRSRLILARAELILGNFAASAAQCEAALPFLLRSQDHGQVSLCRLFMSDALRAQGKYYKALQYGLSGLKYTQQHHIDTLLPTSYLTIGRIYYDQNNFAKAKPYIRKSLQKAQNLNRPKDIAFAMQDLGSVFYQANEFDSALYYYSKSEKLFAQLNILSNLACVYLNTGAVYQNIEQPALARSYYNKCLAIQDKLGDKQNRALSLLNIGVTYEDEGDLKKASNYYFQALDLARKIKLRKFILLCYQNISYNYALQKRFEEALTYRYYYSDLHDSLLSEASLKQVAELQEKYEAEKKENEIAKLKAEEKLKTAYIGRKLLERNIILTILGLLLVLSAFAIYSYRQKIRVKDLLARQADAKNREQLDTMLREQELSAMRAMVEGQEQERQRIAIELHDQLGSMLSTVKLHYSALASKFKNVEPSHWSKTSTLLDEACSEVRRIAHNMASGVLVNFGLLAALHELQQNIESSNNRIQVHIYSFQMDKRLDNQVEINLYRIIQELISNILKHAMATEITLQLNCYDALINIMLEDNGVGFDTETSDLKKGMGLKNIDLRVKRLEGTFTIDSRPGKGTTAIIEIPLKMAHSQLPIDGKMD